MKSFKYWQGQPKPQFDKNNQVIMSKVIFTQVKIMKLLRTNYCKSNLLQNYEECQIFIVLS